MSQTQKYDFVPISYARPRKHNGKAFVSINNKGSIVFNKQCLAQYNLANKYIRFYIDISRNAIGWQVINIMQDFKDIKTKKYRLLKPSSLNIAKLSISHMLQELNVSGKTFCKLKIHEYTDVLYNKIYYIILQK